MKKKRDGGREKVEIVLAVLLILGALTLITADPTGFVLKEGAGKETQVDHLAFVQCLSRNGAVLYVNGNYDSQRQLRMFGAAASSVDAVYCTTITSLCDSRGVTSFPTWEIQGQKYTGILNLGDLADLSACPL